MFNKGESVTVVKGIKVPHGTSGIVFWSRVEDYGERIGFKDAAGATHWTAAKNVVRSGSLAPVAVPLPLAPVNGVRILSVPSDALLERIEALEARVFELEAAAAEVAA